MFKLKDAFFTLEILYLFYQIVEIFFHLFEIWPGLGDEAVLVKNEEFGAGLGRSGAVSEI